MPADPAQATTRSGEYRDTTVAIADARSLAEPPTLDREGFALAVDASAVADFYDTAAVQRVYYREVTRLLKRLTGASDVHVFDHTLRVQDDAKRSARGTRLPVAVAHNDYTERSAVERVRELLPASAAQQVLAHRFAIVNVWRSFGESAERFPLAAADGRSMAPADFVAVDLVYPHRVGEIYHVAHSSAQRWFYFSRMRRHEVMLLKCFDSAPGGRMRYTAHTGFANRQAAAGTPARESIEVRTILSFQRG